MSVNIDEGAIAQLVLKVHAQGLYPVAARVARLDARQVLQDMQHRSLLGRLLKVFAAVRVNVCSLVKHGLRLYLLGVRVLWRHRLGHSLRRSRLSHVVTVT